MEQMEFETLIRRIRPRLHQEAFRHLLDCDEAEDVTQETVLKLWVMRQELNQYRSIEALAVVMARRIALTRKRKKTVPLTDWQKVDLAESNTPEATVISQEEEDRVLRLMSKLPGAQPSCHEFIIDLIDSLLMGQQLSIHEGLSRFLHTAG